jgi:asparagine synthase (glutamine-hydrolysing)
MGKLSTMVQIGRTFGVRDGMLRLGYELQRGSGLISRRIRAVEGWRAWELPQIAPGAVSEALLRERREGSPAFFFHDSRCLAEPLRRIVGQEGEASVVAEAQRVLEGYLPYFGRLSFAADFPPNWFRNPATGESVDPRRPWTAMRFSSPDYGDLKFILEPSRFLFVYPLVRAYALSGDHRYAEAFWTAVEDWALHNPPMTGPMWICGQECSLRIVAWSFGLHGFLGSPATTTARMALLASMIAAHAWRTVQTLGYARSQRSNHLVTEAVGLWTAGWLYPELKESAEWREHSARLLREAVRDQLTPDGVSQQHSFNYQRMVLHLLLWTLRLAEIHHVRLDASVHTLTEAAFDFVRGLVDPVSGHAPNYGSNDGSLVLPLALCDYGDFRPLLQLGATILKKPMLQPGAWDESALWFCGPRCSAQANENASPLAANTGYHRLGDENSWAFVRAGHYHRRPFQADQLHVDVWWRGLNLARDAGSYLYNGQPPWDNGLSGTAVHNTVTVDGRDQMRRVGRFLWLEWAQASGRSFASSPSNRLDCFEGEHNGYRRLGVKHRRILRWLRNAGWVIVDDLLGSQVHDIRLHWLCADLPFEMSETPFRVRFKRETGSFSWSVFSNSPGSGSLVRAGECVGAHLQETERLGWESPTYGEICPAISLIYRTNMMLPVRLITVILTDEAFNLNLRSGQMVITLGDALIYQVGLDPQLGNIGRHNGTGGGTARS